ncbi:flagellar hook protein FlgE [Radicibacter daui]|uniref:flagellar hook protein FlgE n=1 Tax=Radicibacter daui TaxID=3064829 RepID=UPI004046DA81
MSTLFGNFAVGVNALNGESKALSAISNNISNSQTVGYKSERILFSDLLTSHGDQYGVSAPEQRSFFHGMRATADYMISNQGTITPTDRSLDIAISGRGFFPTETTPGSTDVSDLRYTRDGNFVKKMEYPNAPDQTNGIMRLVNNSGNYLMGYPVSLTGQTTTVLQPIEINTSTAAPELAGRATTTMTYQANIPSATETGDSIGTNVTYYAANSSSPSKYWVEWVKTADDNGWTVQARDTEGGTILASQDVTFETPAAGSSAEASGQGNTPTPSDFTVTLGNGQQITMDLSKTTQYASDFIPPRTTDNGYPPGDLEDIGFDDQGFLVGSYSNGQELKLYRLPIMFFNNDDGLKPAEGQDFSYTADAGDMSYYYSGGTTPDGQEPLGGVTPYAVEASTTDIASEFSNLIISQRAYQMATKIITTTDQMTQTAVNSKQ